MCLCFDLRKWIFPPQVLELIQESLPYSRMYRRESPFCIPSICLTPCLPGFRSTLHQVEHLRRVEVLLKFSEEDDPLVIATFGVDEDEKGT